MRALKSLWKSGEYYFSKTSTIPNPPLLITFGDSLHTLDWEAYCYNAAMKEDLCSLMSSENYFMYQLFVALAIADDPDCANIYEFIEV